MNNCLDLLNKNLRYIYDTSPNIDGNMLFMDKHISFYQEEYINNATLENNILCINISNKISSAYLHSLGVKFTFKDITIEHNQYKLVFDGRLVSGQKKIKFKIYDGEKFHIIDKNIEHDFATFEINATIKNKDKFRIGIINNNRYSTVQDYILEFKNITLIEINKQKNAIILDDKPIIYLNIYFFNYSSQNRGDDIIDFFKNLNDNYYYKINVSNDCFIKEQFDDNDILWVEDILNYESLIIFNKLKKKI